MKVKNHLTLWGSLLLLVPLRAQIQIPDERVQHLSSVNVGLDYNIIALSLSYGHYLPALQSAPFLELTQNTALLGLDNFRLQTGLKTWKGTRGRFIQSSSLALNWVKSTNAAGVYHGLGLTLELCPGIRIGRFGLGANLYANPFMRTHIKHSNDYRETYYQAVRDGWYSNTTNNLRVGLFTSCLLNERRNMELTLKGGYQSSGDFDQLIPNLYCVIGINHRLSWKN